MVDRYPARALGSWSPGSGAAASETSAVFTVPFAAGFLRESEWGMSSSDLRPYASRKLPGGSIKVGPPQRVVFANNLDQPTLHQLLQNVGRGHSPDGLDVGSGQRLAIGHDGEGFEARRRQFQPFLTVMDAIKPPGEDRTRQHLIARADAFNPERRTAEIIGHIQLIDDLLGLSGIEQCRTLRDPPGREGSVTDQEGRFHAGLPRSSAAGLFSLLMQRLDRGGPTLKSPPKLGSRKARCPREQRVASPRPGRRAA